MTLILALLIAAQEPPTFRHRVVGLFSAEREADLKEAFKKVAGVTLVKVDVEYAEVTLSYDPKAMSSKKAEKEIVERLNNLLRQASGHTLGIAPLLETPREKLVRVEIGVAGLDCKACCLAVYEVVARVEGVQAATCSLKSGLLTALIDPDKTSKSALEDALKKRQIPTK